ncbi:MAG: hypothetical protein KIT22_01220 [Verrucomicrobiae bacterium]|nr:hypothetical protein [Verrucomicrobiae bacterium]
MRIQVRSAAEPGGDPDEPLVLPYRTADGTALAGQDYQAVSGTLTNLSGRRREIKYHSTPTPNPRQARRLGVLVVVARGIRS